MKETHRVMSYLTLTKNNKGELVYSGTLQECQKFVKNSECRNYYKIVPVKAQKKNGVRK